MVGLSTPLVRDQVAVNGAQGWKRGKRWGGLIQQKHYIYNICTVCVKNDDNDKKEKRAFWQGYQNLKK